MLVVEVRLIWNSMIIPFAVCVLTELVKRWCVIENGMFSCYETERVQQFAFNG